MITVVLVDDQLLVRAGVRALLERAEDIEVVGEAADGAAGVAAVLEHPSPSARGPTDASDSLGATFVAGGRVALAERPSAA